MVLKNTLSLSIYKWYSFVTSLFSWTSFFGIVAISLDRLLVIQLHLRYQELVTQKRVTAVVISIWVFSTILSLVVSFQLIPVDVKTLNAILVVVMGLCFICTTIIYCKIYITVRRHTKEIYKYRSRKQKNGELANARGVLPEKLGRGVRPASQNPYPIYDQNLQFSLPYL